MSYGRLLILRNYGLYAHHQYGQACALKVHQLYDKLIISVLINSSFKS